MITVESQSTVRTAPKLPLTTTLGPVRIGVTDRDRRWPSGAMSSASSRSSRMTSRSSLGVGGKVLIVLELGAKRPVVEHTTGLYHVAIHVPTRADLAQFVVRALQRRVRVSPTDHLVSEAIYLWDADGNGIEITFETPWRGTLGDPDRRLLCPHRATAAPHSGREPIDVDGLLAELGDRIRCCSPACRPARASATSMCMSAISKRRCAFIATGSASAACSSSASSAWAMSGSTTRRTPSPSTSGPAATPSRRRHDAAGLRWFTVNVPDQKTLGEVRAAADRSQVSP